MFFPETQKTCKKQISQQRSFVKILMFAKTLKKWEKSPLSGVTLAASASGIKMQGFKISSPFFSVWFSLNKGTSCIM